jgi:hypothetical protein
MYQLLVCNCALYMYNEVKYLSFILGVFNLFKYLVLKLQKNIPDIAEHSTKPFLVGSQNILRALFEKKNEKTFLCFCDFSV